MNLIDRLANTYPKVGMMTQWWVNWKYTITIESNGKFDAAGDKYPRFEMKRYRGTPKCRWPSDDWGRVGFSIRACGLHLEVSSVQPFRLRVMLGRMARRWLCRKERNER